MHRGLPVVLTVLAVLLANTGCALFSRSSRAAEYFPDPASQALAEAVARGDEAKITELIAAGADPDVTGTDGITMLRWAVKVQSPKGVAALLAAGADPNPLTFACLERRAATFEVLVAAGADVNAVNRLGERAIHTCARTNAGDLVLRLLELGTVPNAKSGSGSTFQDYYFTYDRKVLNDKSIAEREAVIAWLEAHDVPVIPDAYR